LLGDYIDRGPDSPEVLESLIALRGRPDLAIRLLKGNHEQAMLDFLQEPSRGSQWFAFGGLETLLSYGVWPPAPAEGSMGLLRVRDDLRARLPPAHLRLLAGLELIITVGDYAFVHAGVRPGRPLEAQDETDLIWIREPFLGHREPFGKTIVHGHTWTGPEPQLMTNRIGLDTGAFATGVLTAARIEDGEFEILQVRGMGGWG
jgi:serine/threonine protein phosphatase 1